MNVMMSAMRPGTTHCKECRGELVFDPETGENACGMCGVVESSTPELSGMPVEAVVSGRAQPESNLLYDLQLHTLIGGQDVDANGHRVGAELGFGHLRRLNNMTISRSSKTSNELKAVSEIGRIVDSLKLPSSVGIQAQELYRKGLGAGIIRGKSIANMAAASVMIAASSLGIPCSSDEMERNFDAVSGKTARRYYKALIRGLGIEFDRTNPSKHVSGIAGRAGLSTKVERRALEILSVVKDSPSVIDKRSVSIAGAALYIASTEVGEHINQLKLAYAAGITPITIRKRSMQIEEILNSAKEARSLLEELRSEEQESDGGSALSGPVRPPMPLDLEAIVEG
jgi:transcription initiation factor TFIIB